MLYSYSSFSKLFEYKIEKEVELKFSDRFSGYIKKLEPEYSEDIISLKDSKGLYPYTYIDIDEENPKLITFLNNKDSEIEDPWNSNKRQKMKIGKFFSTILPQKPAHEIEKYVNNFSSIVNSSSKFSDFEIVDDEDLVHWYHCNNYDSEGGTIGSSCMRSAEYLEFYEKNPDTVKLLILFNEEHDKIKGRALLWKLFQPEGKTFMDRVYTIDPSDVGLFIEYAKENGYIYKNVYKGSELIDKDGNSYNKLIAKMDSSEDYSSYPYLDTLYYYDSNKGFISNSSSINYDLELQGTDGHASEGDTEHIVDQIEDMSLDEIASVYGIQPILNYIEYKTKFLEEFIDGDVDYYYYDGAQMDFYESKSGVLLNLLHIDYLVRFSFHTTSLAGLILVFFHQV